MINVRKKVNLSMLILLVSFFTLRGSEVPCFKSYQRGGENWKTLIFNEVGMIKYPSSILKIYSNLDIYRESQDSIFAKIPEDGFLINHVNSVGGGDFFQVVFSVSEMDSSELELFNYDFFNLNSSELSALRQYFNEFFDATMGLVPEVQALLETNISPFREKIKVGYLYERRSQGKDKEGMVESMFVMIPLKGKLLTILFEFRKRDISRYKLLREEILNTFSPI